jgi:hypothetical protein
MRPVNGETAAADSPARDRQGSKGKRQHPPSAQATPTPQRIGPLAAPVVIADFWANRRGESVRVQLREFEGLALVDVRRHFTNDNGQLQATKKGLALAVTRLPELAAAINKALARARELDLIDGDAP